MVFAYQGLVAEVMVAAGLAVAVLPLVLVPLLIRQLAARVALQGIVRLGVPVVLLLAWLALSALMGQAAVVVGRTRQVGRVVLVLNTHLTGQAAVAAVAAGKYQAVLTVDKVASMAVAVAVVAWASARAALVIRAL